MAERLLVEEASKVYPGGNHALRGPSFTAEPGTFMVLLGPSGSGKTTLLRSLAGIERLTSGRVAIGATVVADQRTHLPPERRDLSMVFQDYALWPHLCARDNVAFALRRHRLGRHAARQRAAEMLERVGLGHLAERYPVQLSGGEQQRVALARALVGDTGLLLCDEPLSNLDADLRERMRVEISALVREAGATTIYITHDQQEAFALADQVGVLHEGLLVQLGTPEEIYSAPATLFVARFTGLAGELRVRTAPERAAGGGVTITPVDVAARRPIEVRVAPSIAAQAPREAPRETDREAPREAARETDRETDGGESNAGKEHPTEGTMAVRPTAVRLCATDAPVAHLVGTVADTAFRGRHYELVVDLRNGHKLSGVLSERRVPRGTAVGLQLDAAGCILFAGTTDEPWHGTTPGDPTDAQGTEAAAAGPSAGAASPSGAPWSPVVTRP